MKALKIFLVFLSSVQFGWGETRSEEQHINSDGHVWEAAVGQNRTNNHFV